jgi:hypothetical protein
MDDERAEANRKRHRALAVQIKRALNTAASGIQQWLNDDPDEDPYPDVVAGDSRILPRGNRPPPHFHQ